MLTMSYQDKNPLGFTKRTSMILEGLGAGEFVKEFEKQNIPTDALNKLTKDDFLVLGVGDELAEQMVERLKTKPTVRPTGNVDNRDRINKFFEVLKTGNQHLNLIQIFLAYARKRLALEPTDFILDPDKNERASQALSVAAKCTLEDLKQLEHRLSSLSHHLNG